MNLDLTPAKRSIDREKTPAITPSGITDERSRFPCAQIREE